MEKKLLILLATLVVCWVWFRRVRRPTGALVGEEFVRRRKNVPDPVTVNQREGYER